MLPPSPKPALLPAALAALLLLSAPLARAEIFVDRAAETGIDFVHFNGMWGGLYFAEMTGQGGALFDYDGDGDLDVYLIQGHMLGEGKTVEDATFPPKHPLPLSDRLYRNDLEVKPDGTRVLKFTDVTEESGLAKIATGYGMGVAAGDYDNDGHVDLYLTNFGSNQLLHNEGDGTFTDATEKSGTDDRRWSVPTAFFDYDADGWLDLWSGNYVDYRIATDKTCTTEAGAPDYCGPRSYEDVPDRLFHNRGDGTFEEVTGKAGIEREFGAALGVAVTDFDGDGDVDLYVANDGSPNQLWLNEARNPIGSGSDEKFLFENGALLGGCAVNEDGQPEASMGVVAGDFDGNGADDLFMTHLARETNTLYLNDGTGLFEDRSQESGLGRASWQYTGFGTALADYDNDGWLDLYVANGAVLLIEEQVRAGETYPLKQKNLLFHNKGVGPGGVRFEEVSTEEAGKVFELLEVGRGVAMGDVDNDGDSDLLLANNAGPARLLINRVGQDAPWLGLRLVGGEPPRDMLGARVGLFRKDAPTLWRQARTDGSYASAGDPRVLFGLGGGSDVVKVRVVWPGGRVEEWKAPPLGEYTALRQGTGTAVEAP